eukprot:356817-Chlamydomonas_euryale.AAC.1
MGPHLTALFMRLVNLRPGSPHGLLEGRRRDARACDGWLAVSLGVLPARHASSPKLCGSCTRALSMRWLDKNTLKSEALLCTVSAERGSTAVQCSDDLRCARQARGDAVRQLSIMLSITHPCAWTLGPTCAPRC